MRFIRMIHFGMMFSGKFEGKFEGWSPEKWHVRVDVEQKGYQVIFIFPAKVSVEPWSGWTNSTSG